MLFRAIASAAALAVTVVAQGGAAQSVVNSLIQSSEVGSVLPQTTNVSPSAPMNSATSPAGIPSPTSTDSMRQPPLTLVTGTAASGSALATSLSSQSSSATMSAMSATMSAPTSMMTGAGAASSSMAAGSDNAAAPVGVGHIHALGAMGVVAAGFILL